MTPAEMVALVQRQVDAYNAHDIDGFVATYAPDAVIESRRSGVLGRGHEWIRARYGPLFAGGSPPADILSRAVVGNWIVDEEFVSRPDGDIHVLVAYRLSGGSIGAALFLDD